MSELEAAKAASIADDDDYWSGTSGDDCSYIDGIENTQGSNHNHSQHYCDSGHTVDNNTSNSNSNSNQTDYDLQRALLLSGLEVKTQNGMLSWEEEQQLQYDTYAAQRQQQQQQQQQQQKNYTDSNSNSVKTNDKSGSNTYSSFDATPAQQQQRQPEHLHEQQPPDLINEPYEEENRDDVDYYPTIPRNHQHQSDFNQTASNTVMTMPASMPAATSAPSGMTALLARKRRSSSSMIVSFDTLKIFYHEDFDSLLKSGRVKINTIPTYQGRIPDSVSF